MFPASWPAVVDVADDIRASVRDIACDDLYDGMALCLNDVGSMLVPFINLYIYSSIICDLVNRLLTNTNSNLLPRARIREEP